MTTTHITVHNGPWHATWNGGRLADVYHAESDTALDCFQVGEYDWQKGKLVGEISEDDLRQHLAEWIEEQGETFSQEPPYL